MYAAGFLSHVIKRHKKLPSLMQFHMLLFKKIRDHPHQKRDARKNRHLLMRGDTEKAAFLLARLCAGMGYSNRQVPGASVTGNLGILVPQVMSLLSPLLACIYPPLEQCPILSSPVQER